MHDAFGMGIAQCVRDQSNGWQHRLDGLARQHAHVDTTDELQAVVSAFRVIVKFEYAHDVRMHEIAADSPFPVQQVAMARVFRESGGKKFEGDA